jgi:Flp pilus assembly protein CpaB
VGAGQVVGAEPALARRSWRSRISAGHAAMALAGLLGALFTIVALHRADDRAEVMVAARDLPAGAVVHPRDFTTARVGASNDTLERLVRAGDSALRGGVLTARLGAGDLVARAELRPRAAPGDRRAMSIPIAPSHAVDGHLQPGDRVDVVAADDRQVAIVIANAEVLDVDTPGGVALGNAGNDLSVTLAVDARQSQLLAAAVAKGNVFLTRATGTRAAVGLPPIPLLVGGSSAAGTAP